MMARKTEGWGTIIFLVLTGFLTTCLSGCAFVNVSLFRGAQPLQEKVIEGDGPGKVLVMDISGVLSYPKREKLGTFKEPINVVARVKEELRKAARDKEIKAIVLRIHSPGGTVNASDLLHHELMEYKKEKDVKIVACFLGMATSGGYYVATAADHIVAQPTSLTGSIGTIALKFNIRGLMDKVGVEEETIKSGDMKDIWSPFRPSTHEERKILQRIIGEYQGNFLQVVRAGRSELTEADVAILSDGRVFTGEQALKLHLVDQLGYLDDAVEWAQRATGMKGARVVAYHRPGTYVENIYSLSQGDVWTWLDRLQQREMFYQGPTTQFMYLWIP